jgi:hypothetical protein
MGISARVYGSTSSIQRHHSSTIHQQLVLKHRQQWEQDNRSRRTGNLRKSAKEPRICLEENQLTANDWDVLEHLAKLLGFYEDAVKTLEGDGQLRKRKGGWVGSYGMYGRLSRDSSSCWKSSRNISSLRLRCPTRSTSESILIWVGKAQQVLQQAG